MTRTQAEIIASIASLPEGDRRALVQHLVETHLGEGAFVNQMTAAQRLALDEGIAQADRSELLPAHEVFDRVPRRGAGER
jgi:hypothetical protein